MTPTEAGVREYCANTRENVNPRIGFKFLLAQVVENSETSGRFPIHHTANNIPNVSALVRRFIKMCDVD